MNDDEPSLFPDLVPVPVADGYEGLGHDARRTRRQHEILAEGYNPGTRIPLHPEAAAAERVGPGLRCKGCAHLYKTGAGNKAFLKCEQAGTYNSRGSMGPDMRAWWPACRLYEAKEDTTG